MRGAHEVGLVDVARLGAVGEHFLEHAGGDLANDLGEGEWRRRACGRRGVLALAVRIASVVEGVVLVEFLGVGGGVVEDVDRVPRCHLGGAVGERLAGGIRRPAVGGPDAELGVRRVGVSVKVSSTSPAHDLGSGVGPRQTLLVEGGLASPELLSGSVAEAGVA